MANAVMARQTHNPGTMRRPRAAKYAPSLGLLSQLDVMRNPETAKNPSTHVWLKSW
jgi:hypothetical protein